MLIDRKAPSVQACHDIPLMTLSAYRIQGRRNHMEDFFDIAYQMKPQDRIKPDEFWPYDFFYFGVYDGHGGAEAARFAKKNLLKFITEQKDFWSNDDKDVMRAIQNGFAQTHTAMRKVMPTWSKTSKTLPSTAGTTASVLFIKNNKFYSGHVGDSRIVICEENPETKHWISNQITEDHKPESEAETSRISRAGGEVRSKIGVHRVVWKRPVLDSEQESKSAQLGSLEYDYFLQSTSSYPFPESIVTGYQTIPFLAIARSLGDFWSINQHTGLYVVSPEPDVSCRPIKPSDKCILLATDGLWNVMNSDLATRFLQELDILKSRKRADYPNEYFWTDNFYDAAGTENNHARSMVYCAYQIWERRRLKSDNITVVVSRLHDILTTNHHDKFEKSYATRTSMQIAEKIPDFVKPKCTELVQLPTIRAFNEVIKVNQTPKFSTKESPVDTDYYLNWLENYINLPPTLLEHQSKLSHPKHLTCPRNYFGFAAAECRKITRYPYMKVDPFHEDWNIHPDQVIHIKNYSDDPADEVSLPTRINKLSGKEVKDASAQATQSIHDFSQPWDQLLDENKNSELDDEEFQEAKLLSFKSDISLIDDVSIDEATNTSSDSDSDLNCKLEITREKELDETLAKESQKEEKSIPQLRCLLNYTPPLRRSARNTYLSSSESVKRKAQYISSIPRRKRRKSQPVRRRITRV